MMDDNAQRMLYILPHVNEIDALQAVFDEDFCDKYDFHVVHDQLKEGSKVSFATHKTLQVLLKNEALPDQLVVVLDASAMPITVDMEIAVALFQEWIEKLSRRVDGSSEEDSPSGQTVNVVAFCTTSAYEKCSWTRQLVQNDKTKVTAVQGLRPQLPEHKVCSGEGLTVFSECLEQFAQAAIQGYHAWRQANPDPDAKYTSMVLLCIMKETVFNEGMLPHESMRQHLGFYAIDHAKPSVAWLETTNDHVCDSICAFTMKPMCWNIVLLDPDIGIVYPMPTITDVYIDDTQLSSLYDADLRRVIAPRLDYVTTEHLYRHLGLFESLEIHSLSSFTLSNALLTHPQRCPWTPATTSEVPTVLLTAHCTWPTKLLDHMPLRFLEQYAVADSVRHLEWYGIMRNRNMNQDLREKLMELLEHVPSNFNVVMLLLGIHTLEPSSKAARAIIQMALLLKYGPDRLMRCTIERKTKNAKDKDDGDSDSGHDSSKSRVFEHLARGYLPGVENVRQGRLLQAWVCLNKTLSLKWYQDKQVETDTVKWVELVDGFEVEWRLVHHIERE